MPDESPSLFSLLLGSTAIINIPAMSPELIVVSLLSPPKSSTAGRDLESGFL